MDKKQRRMKKMVEYFQEYVNSYSKQKYYMNYSDKTFIEDMIYGIGLSLAREKDGFEDGFEKFKEKLRKII